MSAPIILTDQLTVTVNSVDFTDHCAAFTVQVTAADVAANTLGSQYGKSHNGLKDGTVTLSLQSDYAAGSVNKTIGPLFTANAYATVVASGTLGGTAVSGTAICRVNSVTPIGGAVGDLMTQDLTWPTVGSVTGWGL